MADTLDRALDIVRDVQTRTRASGKAERPRWPMIVLVSPKGWTGPKVVDGKPVEGTWRAHQVPLDKIRENPGHLRLLEDWMRSYRPGELFDEHGSLRPELRALAPNGEKRMGANPHANGGALLVDLDLPAWGSYAVAVPKPGAVDAEATRVMGRFLRDTLASNAAARNFRLFSPDETESNRWGDVFEVTDRMTVAEILPTDENLSADGRVLEMLSEHQCEGWLEGYLLTGRHGFFACYEAFIHIVDSMFNQHAKWLKTTRRIPWRKPIASLNILLSSHVWRQDHNGFSHQDPGFLDHVANKKAEVIRIYLPPDANTLLSVTDHCLRSRHYVNVVVAGKQPAPQWLDMEAASRHAAAGIGVWEWASHDGAPDVVVAAAGDVPTLEALAAVSILRREVPDLRIRFVNVVDLMRLQPPSEHPHGLSDAAFDSLFTTDRPVLFAFHGYPSLIHQLAYRRRNHDNLHVRGYKEEGTTTTPFDMCVLNDLDRFRLAMDVIDRVPGLERGRPPCASASTRSAGSTANGCAGPATICPRSGTGAGRREAGGRRFRGRSVAEKRLLRRGPLDRGDLVRDERARLAPEHERDVLERADRGRLPGSLREVPRGLDLRPHRARHEVEAGERGWRGPAYGAGVLRSPSRDHGRDVRGHDEGVGLDLLGEKRCHAVLVDHGFDAEQLAVVAVHGGNPAPAPADHDRPLLEEPAHGADLEDALRQGRGHDAPPRGTVPRHGPAPLLREAMRLLFTVDGADRLVGLRERRVGRIHLDHRQEGRERDLEGQEIPELLLDEVADHSFGLGAEDVEREVRGVEPALGLKGEEADLGAVPVRDDELVLPREGRERHRCPAHVRALPLGRHRFAAAKQGIPPEGDDDAHAKPVSPPERSLYAAVPSYIPSIIFLK